MMPGRGPALCAGRTRAGRPCFDYEIEGFGRCLRHVHPDQLEDAEAVCGIRLCRRPDCLGYAISWTSPPRCKTHLSGLARQIEHMQLIRYQVEVRQAEIMSALFAYQDGDRSHEVLHLLGLDDCAMQRLAGELMAQER